MLRGCTAPATCSTLIFADIAGAQGSWVPVSHGFGVRGASHTGTDSTLVQLPKNKTRRLLHGRSHGSHLQSIPSFFMVRQRSLIITDVRFWKGYFRQMAFHLPSPYFFTPSLIHSLSCMVHFCKEQGSSFREELHDREPAANSFLAHSFPHHPCQERQGRQTGPGSCTHTTPALQMWCSSCLPTGQEESS